MNSSGSAGRGSRIFVLASAALAALVLTAAAPASAGTLDQEQTSYNISDSSLSAGSAQTFTAGISGGLDQADLMLKRMGTPPDVTVEIRTTSGGVPTATVLATGTIGAAALGTTPAFVPVTFATPAPVTAGTQYALVAYATSGARWAYRQDDFYPGGQVFITSDNPPGANWTGLAFNDFAFRTYVSPATQPAPPPPSAKTGLQAAALKKCKKRAQKHDWSKDRLRKCKRKARLLPV